MASFCYWKLIYRRVIPGTFAIQPSLPFVALDNQMDSTSTCQRGQHHAYAVVDSLPIELCHHARIYRVKRFQGIADIGYCEKDVLLRV
ncbi:hypothetical protein BV455_03386 [Parageobacillus caldoxylosilyticus]|jgi:hypothetical protein|nr:hypothetical protein BV455_03386 [Parageobacillus caldoxylosilyticus]